MWPSGFNLSQGPKIQWKDCDESGDLSAGVAIAIYVIRMNFPVSVPHWEIFIRGYRTSHSYIVSKIFKFQHLQPATYGCKLCLHYSIIYLQTTFANYVCKEILYGIHVIYSDNEAYFSHI